MKCQYLITIDPAMITVIQADDKLTRIRILELAKDIKVCVATKEQCPKKKQLCEINRRCWELGR